jgi:hypothetical protein
MPFLSSLIPLSLRILPTLKRIRAFTSNPSHRLHTLILPTQPFARATKRAAAKPPSKNRRPESAYRPAPAAAAFGATPARFIPSILFSTDSMLVPVSTQASTYGCRLPSACITNTLVSALAFFTIYGK